MGKLPLSACIISFNEADNIKRCIESISSLAEEVIVVDSHSTDRTVEIAEQHGAIVYTEDWKGHVAQKNSALDKCSQPWIISLDCDEEVSPELKDSLQSAIARSDADGYFVNRKTYCLGKWINYSWYPDRKLRVIKNGLARWEGYDPHDSLETKGTVKKLTGDLFHYPMERMEDLFSRTVAYAVIGAESYIKQGKKASLFNIIFNPAYSFIKHYFLKRGFLDGIQGFFIASASGYYTFLKYSIIWDRQRRTPCL